MQLLFNTAPRGHCSQKKNMYNLNPKMYNLIKVWKKESNNIVQCPLNQGCQTHGLLEPIGCWQSCRGPQNVFDLEITTSPGNDFCNVDKSKINLNKEKIVTSPISPHHRSSSHIVNRKSSSVARSGVDFQIEKSVYLSSVACVKRFKRWLEDEKLEYCRNSLRILESFHGLH